MSDRTFSSVSIVLETGEELELRCPKCHCPKLLFHEDVDDFSDGWMYYGKKVTCCECQHEFVVTENCWEATGERY